MSLAFVWGQAGLLCFGQAIFFGIGAYAMAAAHQGHAAGDPGRQRRCGLLAAVAAAGAVRRPAGGLAPVPRPRRCPAPISPSSRSRPRSSPSARPAIGSFIGGFNGLMDVPPLASRRRSGARRAARRRRPCYYVMLAAAALGSGSAAVARALAAGHGAARDPRQRGAHRLLRLRRRRSTRRFAFASERGVAGLRGRPVRDAVRLRLARADRRLAVDRGADLDRARRPRGAARRVPRRRSWCARSRACCRSALGYYWLLALGVLFVLSVVFFPRGLLGLAAAPAAARPPNEIGGEAAAGSLHASAALLGHDRVRDLPAERAERLAQRPDRGGALARGHRLDQRATGAVQHPLPARAEQPPARVQDRVAGGVGIEARDVDLDLIVGPERPALRQGEDVVGVEQERQVLGQRAGEQPLQWLDPVVEIGQSDAVAADAGDQLGPVEVLRAA